MSVGRKDPTASPPPPDEDENGTSQKSDWIGANLREVYDETLNEPVPDRFLEILNKIEKKARDS